MDGTESGFPGGDTVVHPFSIFKKKGGANKPGTAAGSGLKKRDTLLENAVGG